MRVAGTLRSALVFAALVIGASAHAACNSTYAPLSEHAFQPNHPGGPVAWNGSVVGVARTTLGSPISFSVFDPNSLQQIGPERVVTTSTYAGQQPILRSNGSEFGLFFLTPANTIIYQRIGPAGSALADEVRIGATHGAYANMELDADWDPVRGAYVVLYSIPTGNDVGLWLAAVRPDGTIISDDRVQLFISGDPQPHVRVGNDGVVAFAWRRPDSGVDVLTIEVMDRHNQQLLISSIAANGRLPRLGTTGSQFALVYQASASGGTTELRWVRFDTTGKFVSTDSRLLAGTGIDVMPSSIAGNAMLGEWAVTYIDASLGVDAFPGDYRLRRLTLNGGVIADVLFTPDPVKSIFASQDPIVWTGAAYFGTVSRYFSQAEGSDSLLVRHCPVDAVPQPSVRTALLLQPVTFTANASGGVAPYKYSWDFGDFGDVRPEANPTHSFIRPGTYTVTLTVTDAMGEPAVRTTTVIVAASLRSRAVRH